MDEISIHHLKKFSNVLAAGDISIPELALLNNLDVDELLNFLRYEEYDPNQVLLVLASIASYCEAAELWSQQRCPIEAVSRFVLLSGLVSYRTMLTIKDTKNIISYAENSLGLEFGPYNNLEIRLEQIPDLIGVEDNDRLLESLLYLVLSPVVECGCRARTIDQIKLDQVLKSVRGVTKEDK